MTKETDYIEAVGLITIGFAIYDTVFGAFAPSEVVREWGLTAEFGLIRVTLIVAQCLFIGASLELLRGYEVIDWGPLPADKPFREVVRWAFRGRLSKNEMRMNAAMLLQVYSTGFSFALFGAKTATCLALGFAFVDISLWRKKKPRPPE